MDSKRSQPPFRVPDWKAAAATKRAELHQSIPQDWLLPPSFASDAASGSLRPEDSAILSFGILTATDIEITNINDVANILARLHSRQYTAVQVTTAFCKRAAIAQQCLSCLTEFFPDAAINQAAKLDAEYERTGKPSGILHGLPVSVKDCFGIAGRGTTAGLVSWIGNIPTSNAVIVDAIISAGGILYAKTNVSQAYLMVESINNVFGTVRNPYNPQLSAGGSSGGEAALIAAKGSPLGTGTDGGGSIRFPAMFCGLWGLKASKGRLPGMGLGSPRDGSESVNGGFGPMAKTVKGLELWLEAQFASKPWDRDPGCIPMDWKREEAQQPKVPLNIGVIWDDGVVKPVPPVTRALRLVVEALKRAGHNVFDLPEDTIKSIHRRGTSCVMKSNVQGGGHTVMQHIAASGEPVVPRTATGSAASALTTQEVFANHLVRGGLNAEYTALWEQYQMDAILAPAVAHPAPPHGKYISNSYAGIYNMLDYVTGSIPVTTVDPDLDVADRDWYNREPYERIEPVRFPYDFGDKEMIELYSSPAVFENAPVGVQIACKRLREEKCLGILKEVEELLRTE